jgi:hypothetical protein
MLPLVSIVVGFPSYENPLTVGPPVLAPAAECEVTLFDHAGLSTYGQIAVSEYSPPAKCPGPWSSVTLRWIGAVRGVQFDRYGALWLSGVELLRTTTPEPDADGIEWRIARDLTPYSSLFTAAGNASLAIPNVVDTTYTGVLYISVNISFVSALSRSTLRRAHVAVMPIHDPLAGGSPFDAMGVRGTAYVSGSFSLSSRDVVAARVDLYASGHGDEEFWYSNVPSSFANATGAPGGGAYRELQIFVDGVFAGAAYPFPVVYSGGVCPLLWRPLAGTHQFNIPPYSFDLAPFLGRLNDGEPHSIAASVYGNSANGLWYLDPVLVATHQPGAGPISGDVNVTRSPPEVNVSVELANATKHSCHRPCSWRFRTRAASSYAISGEARSPSGAVVGYSLRGTLRALNDNLMEDAVGGGGAYSDDSAGVTAGEMERRVITTVTTLGRRSSAHSGFVTRFGVNDSETEASDSFRIVGAVRLASARTEQPVDGAALSWSTSVNSTAAYNRSTDSSRTAHVMEGVAAASFDSAAACVTQQLAAANGSFTRASITDGCPRSAARALLCSAYDECGPPAPPVPGAWPEAVHLSRGAQPLLWRSRRRPSKYVYI